MVRSIESVTVHSNKELHCRSFIWREGKKWARTLGFGLLLVAEHWEQWDWSPLGGWIPSVRIVLLEDESARGDQSKELRSCSR